MLLAAWLPVFAEGAAEEEEEEDKAREPLPEEGVTITLALGRVFWIAIASSVDCSIGCRKPA
jgi:hypothetical protein